MNETTLISLAFAAASYATAGLASVEVNGQPYYLAVNEADEPLEVAIPGRREPVTVQGNAMLFEGASLLATILPDSATIARARGEDGEGQVRAVLEAFGKEPGVPTEAVPLEAGGEAPPVEPDSQTPESGDGGFTGTPSEEAVPTPGIVVEEPVAGATPESGDLEQASPDGELTEPLPKERKSKS